MPTFATLERLPPAECANCLRWPRRYVAGGIAISPVLLSVCACCGTAILGTILENNGVVQPGNAVNFALMVILGISFLATPLTFFAFAWLYNDVGQSWFYLYWLNGAIRNRAAPIVHPHDDEAWFIERIPRYVWGVTPSLENADEVGFLLIDHTNRRLLYEGDSERWILPADAIDDHRIGTWKENDDFLHMTWHWMVVLDVRTEMGILEMPLCLRHADELPSTMRRKRGEANWLLDQIDQLTGRTAPGRATW